MAKRVGVDKWLFGVVLLLVLFGLVMVFSASAVLAKETLGSPYSYVGRQAIWAALLRKLKRRQLGGCRSPPDRCAPAAASGST